jgi:UDP-4-amino-4,6-dideoxy-N-acetyl-beta-L-altrosamine N-acetyltransferase
MKEIKLINFIDLNYEEKNMVLEWRNRLDIQKMMYSQSDIPLEKHLEFIDSLRVITDKLYFLVKKDNINIGVIYFTQIKSNESLVMGIYANPNLKGYGKILLETIIYFSFEILKVVKIYSEVYFENEKAYLLYKSYGFKEYAEKIVNNKKVICMDLNNKGKK